MHVDYIIVGQGLAGSAVAFQLLKRNKKILVIDQPDHNSSSRIAAGLFNPITGRKMVKTWMADELFPCLFRYYRDVESQTGISFFHPMPIYRPFLSAKEQNEWMGKSSDPAYTPYIESVNVRASMGYIRDEWGGLLLRQCGYLQTSAYIGAVKSMILKENIFLEGPFEEENLQIDSEEVGYKSFHARKIIFCQGIKSNRWFNWMPVRSLKGETVRLEFKTAIGTNAIINRGVYCIPEGGAVWRVGGTYDFNDHQPGSTSKAKEELVQKVGELVHPDFFVLSQEWGFRPTTPDRRPLLGAHPQHPSLIAFNGLGTKGVSLSPYFSEVLVRWLENEGTLNKVVDLERYKSVYSSSPK